jgi:hypothetical protein
VALLFKVASSSQAKQGGVIRTCTTAAYTIVRLAKMCSTAAAYSVLRLAQPCADWATTAACLAQPCADWATTAAYIVVRLAEPYSTAAACIVLRLAKPSSNWATTAAYTVVRLAERTPLLLPTLLCIWPNHVLPCPRHPPLLNKG